MQVGWIRIIDKVCCETMQIKLDNGSIALRNNWNFYWGDEVIFYCPFCGKRCF